MEEAAEALFQEVLEVMQPLPSRIAALLTAHGHDRCITKDADRRWLSFIQKELDDFGLALTRSSRRVYGDHPHMVKWLQDLKEQAGGISELLSYYEQDGPLPPTLLQRVAQRCCATANKTIRFTCNEIRYKAEELYHSLNDPCRYTVHLPQLLEWFKPHRAHISRGEVPDELIPLINYMNMFPNNYMFEKDCLGMKWMNEGLVHSEEEAEEYFCKLVNRKFFTRVAPNWEYNLDEAETYQWEVDNFKVHPFSESRIGFVFTGDMLTSLGPPTIMPGSGIQLPRRLALHKLRPADSQGLMQASDWGENVRSLAVSGTVDQVPLNKFNYLVVLDMEHWRNLKDEDLLQICNSKMYLLRYLSVRNTQVSKLPPQIKELCSLRTLDASHTQISELPSEVFELEHLIKLDLRSTKIRKLLEKIVGLQKLEYLLVGGDTTLGLIKYPLSFTSALGYLACLRVLAITCSFQQCTDKAYQDAWLSSMKNWRQLESLTIHCGPGSSLEFLLVLSSDPPMSLQKLKVTTGRFVSVPQWIKWLQHLSFLQITICKLAPDDLIMLRDLPKLKSLVLGLEFIPRVEIVIEGDGFKELLKFSVDCPVPWLTFRQGAMPKLECLQLKLCSGPAREGSVPSGLLNLVRITEVVLCYNQKWCHSSSSVKMTVEAVKREVAKHHNPIDLVICGTVHDVRGEADGSEAREGAQAAGEETRRIKIYHKGDKE